MKIYAYPETYLSSAQSAQGDMFDYAVNVFHISGEEFVKLFLASSVSTAIENGEPKYLSGKSGIEIVMEILEETTGKTPLPPKDIPRYHRSREYWIGWSLAYYQWYSLRSFSEILQAIPYRDYEILYETLHEADITKFLEIAENRVREHFPDTNLKRLRTLYGLTQSKLASRSGVSLRSIQMYEQRQKDINKASADSLYRLSKVLGCRMEDLVEK